MMDNSENISVTALAKWIFENLCELRKHEQSSIIQIHTSGLKKNGELSFPYNIEDWRGYVNVESDRYKNSKNIVNYYYQDAINYESPDVYNANFKGNSVSTMSYVYLTYNFYFLSLNLIISSEP